MNKLVNPKVKRVVLSLLPLTAVAVCLLFFYRDFIAGEVFGWDDDMYVFYPGASYFATSIKEGIFPLWLPGLRCGMPFYSDVQMGVFYPLKWLLVFMVEDGELPQQAYQTYLVFQYFIGAVLFFLLMRMHGKCRTSSAVGTLVYCFSGFMARHIIFFASVEVMLWLPLVLMAIKYYYQKKGLRRALLISLAVLMTFLPGFPQVTVYVSYFAIAYWLVLAIYEQREKGADWKSTSLGVLRQMAVAAAVFVFAAAMGAVAFFPAFENWKLSHRTNYGYDEVADTSMPFYYVVNMFFPNFTGVMHPTGNAVQYWGFNRDCMGFERYKTAYWHFWDLSCYAGQVGIIALLYSVVFIRSIRKTPFRLVCTIAAVLAFWFMLGRYGGFFRVLYEALPGISAFRGPGRMSCVMNAAQAVLVVYFIGDLLRGDNLKRIRRFLLVILGGYFVFLILFVSSGSGWCKELSNEKVFDHSIRQIFTGIGFAGTLTAVAYLVGRESLKKYRGAIYAVLFLSVFFDLLGAHGSFHKGKRNAQDYFADKGQLVDKLKAYQAQTGICRFGQVRNGKLNESVVFPRNMGYLHDVEFPEGYVLFIPSSISMVRRHLPEETVRDLLNIGVMAEQTQHGISIKTRPSSLPRASFYSKVRTFGSREDMFKAVSSNALDYKEEIAVLGEHTDGKAEFPMAGSMRERCRVTKVNNNAWEIATSSDQPGIIFVSQSYYPGWIAQDSGDRQFDVIETFGGLTGIIIPEAYTGDITLEFKPSILLRGGMVSGVLISMTLVGLIAPGLVRKNKKKTEVSSAPAEG